MTKQYTFSNEEASLIKYALQQLAAELPKAVDVYSQDVLDSEQIERAKAFALDLQLCNQLCDNQFKDIKT